MLQSPHSQWQTSGAAARNGPRWEQPLPRHMVHIRRLRRVLRHRRGSSFHSNKAVLHIRTLNEQLWDNVPGMIDFMSRRQGSSGWHGIGTDEVGMEIHSAARQRHLRMDLHVWPERKRAELNRPRATRLQPVQPGSSSPPIAFDFLVRIHGCGQNSWNQSRVLLHHHQQFSFSSLNCDHSQSRFTKPWARCRRAAALPPLGAPLANIV